MSEKQINIGFLGGGMMCQVGHLPFYDADPRCSVAMIAEPRPSLKTALANKYRAATIVDDYRDLLESPEIDAVVISAPRPATGPLTLEALAAGKHVLAEKPMAHTVEQGDRLVRSAGERNLLYAVGYMRRFDPGIGTAVEIFSQLMKNGRLGSLQLARFFDFSKSYAMAPPPHTRPAESRAERFDTWPLWPDWLAVDFRDTYAWFLNAGCHDINLLRLFFPSAQKVVATYCRPGGAVAALLDIEGVPVHLDMAKTAAGRWLQGAEFLFEHGRLRFEVPSPMDIHGVSRIYLDNESSACTDTPDAKGNGWAFARQATGFLDALTGSAPLRNPGAEGLEDLRLSEAIWRQAQEP